MPRFSIADSSLFNVPDEKNNRGLNVFTLSELRGLSGQTKSGELVTGRVQQPFFSLSPDERISIMQSSAYVFAVISSRMNRISALEWDIVAKKDIEDEYYYQFKELKQLFDEHSDLTNMKHLMLRFRIRLSLQKELPGLLDDLSNFDAAMIRYKKSINRKHGNKRNEIKEWINHPNQEDDFSDWIKKWVESLLVHGAAPVYKEYLNDSLENFYVLPGGTVYPLRGLYVGSYVGYAQVVVGYMPKIYFQDEMVFTSYLPSAARSYGYVPLDALINKVSEQMLFDQFAAERADGTKEPEKLIVFGDNRNPFGDLTGEISFPMDGDKQKRIEEKLNQIRKGAIATISGVGHPVVEDISKADTFSQQSERQDKLLRDIALVYNMTNMEINLAGGEFTTGRETSETQQEIEEGKGTQPIIQKIQNIFNQAILPFRFGNMNIFQYKKGLNEFEQVKLDTMKQQSGTYTKNEIRISRGDDPIMEEGNDSLKTSSEGPGMSPFSPINMRTVE